MAQLTADKSNQTLKKGALGLGDVFMQAIAHTAPATAILFTIPFIYSKAGVTAPLAYLFAFLLVLMLGITMAQLAKHLPSAGGYYTYISHTISPRAGFFTSWMYLLYDPLAAGYALAFTGYIVQQALLVNYNIYFPWWLFLIITGGFVGFSTYRGIKISAKLLLVMGLIEIACVLVLSCWGLTHPGNGGVNLQSFNISKAPSSGGLAMGVVFSVFALVGWEGVAPMAEESEDPKRTLPKAIVYCIIAMGLFLVFCSWGIITGLGTNNTGAFTTAKENPTFVLARSYWGPAWIVLIFALVNSMVAVAISCNNVATRMWFAMGRSGSMPRFFAVVHPKFQTPKNAVIFQTLLTIAFGLCLSWIIGVENDFDFMGLVITFTLAIVYAIGNIGVVKYYRTEKKAEFNIVLHLLFPIIGIIVLAVIIYYALIPWPEAPIGYAFWVVVAWLVVGLIVLAIMKATKKEAWRANAGNTTIGDNESVRE